MNSQKTSSLFNSIHYLSLTSLSSLLDSLLYFFNLFFSWSLSLVCRSSLILESTTQIQKQHFIRADRICSFFWCLGFRTLNLEPKDFTIHSTTINTLASSSLNSLFVLFFGEGILSWMEKEPRPLQHLTSSYIHPFRSNPRSKLQPQALSRFQSNPTINLKMKVVMRLLMLISSSAFAYGLPIKSIDLNNLDGDLLFTKTKTTVVTEARLLRHDQHSSPQISAENIVGVVFGAIGMCFAFSSFIRMKSIRSSFD